MRLYGVTIKQPGMSDYTTILANGTDFTLSPPGRVGQQHWTLRKAENTFHSISVFRAKDWINAIHRALTEIQKHLEKGGSS
jgi:hypothetical protein